MVTILVSCLIKRQSENFHLNHMFDFNMDFKELGTWGMT